MKLDIFCEVEKADIDPDGGDRRLIKETIEQAKFADKAGFDCWWEVEHHGAVEMSYSSAPEIILAAISQHTQRLRIGHAAILTPHKFIHPIKIAERCATLDIISDGRLEVGFARSTIPEWRLFQMDPEATRGEMEESMRMVPQMWTQDKFNWESENFSIKDISIIPKPVQKPHPPMWQAATSANSFEMAGRLGVGILGVTLLTPVEAMAGMLASYREAIKDADPVGKFINNQAGVFTFVHVAETTKKAIENGAAAAAAWYMNTITKFFELQEMMRQIEESLTPPADPAGLSRFGLESDGTPAESTKEDALGVIGRLARGEEISGEEIYEHVASQGGVIIGDVETCKKKMEQYRDIGCDRLLCFQQVGGLSHEAIIESMRLTGEHLIPYFQGK